MPVFLHPLRVDVRRPGDIGEFIGQEIRAVVLKIDTERRNIVISRRKLIEEERGEQRKKLLETIKEGDIVKGTVKNIADFGAFVDLGGIDGLLHITDMSWGRVNHPSDIVKIDQVIEVRVLDVDRDKEKIALGLKQKESSPWQDIEKKYPVNTRVKGVVTNIMSYGAFVKLEDGVEGLVHISEMSWTKRINHPSEMVSIGEEIEVVVLDINKDKQEISLGMKQTEVNPWDLVAEKYPRNVRRGRKSAVNLATYGPRSWRSSRASTRAAARPDLSWTGWLAHPNEMLKKGDSDQVRGARSRPEQAASGQLGLKQMTQGPWVEAIPSALPAGHDRPGQGD